MEIVKTPEYSRKPMSFKIHQADGTDRNIQIPGIVKGYSVRQVFTDNELRIKELKKLLADTDYQAIKYAEGELTAEEYAPIKAQRQAWREEINTLEATNE